MKKKVLAVAICILMLAALLPVTAYAAVDYTMDFSTDSFADWNNGMSTDYSTTDDFGAGWSWAHESKTLTLSGLNFSTADGIALKLPADSTIVLAAGTTNTVASTYNEMVVNSYGIWCSGALTIGGAGRLSATGGTPTSGSGVGSSRYRSSYGISADGGLTIAGGTVNATGGTSETANSWGIYAGNAITISGGTVNATGGTASSTSCGIESTGRIAISSATVRATGGSGDGTTFGIFAYEVGVSSGVVTATGGTAANGGNSYGIGANGAIEISGGKCTAKGGTRALYTRPTLGDGVTAKASVNANGSGAVDYAPDANDTYRWFNVGGVDRPKASGGKGSDKTTAYSEDDNVKVIVENGDVTITAMEKDSADYTLLLRGQSGEPVMAYEIDGERGVEAIVMFYVGRENAGKEYTVLHKLADGSIEEFHVICAVNGWITVRVKEFSPFMVFAGSVGGGTTVATTSYVENPDTGANDVTALAAALGTLALLGCCVIGKKRK